MLAVIFYRLVKVLEYETANPGQDQDAPHSFAAEEEGRRTASESNNDSGRMPLNNEQNTPINPVVGLPANLHDDTTV